MLFKSIYIKHINPKIQKIRLVWLTNQVCVCYYYTLSKNIIKVYPKLLLTHYWHMCFFIYFVVYWTKWRAITVVQLLVYCIVLVQVASNIGESWMVVSQMLPMKRKTTSSICTHWRNYSRPSSSANQ